MQRSRHRPRWGFWLAGLAGLIIGTVLGQTLSAVAGTWLGHPIVLSPWTLNLYVLGFTLWLRTNPAGVLLAVLAVLIYGAV